MITDREKIIATSKDLKNYLTKELSSSIKNSIVDRKEIIDTSLIVSNLSSNFYLLPIIVNSDILGSFILIDNNILDNDKDIIHLLNTILIKNIEE